MADLVTAFGLVFVIEGLLWALFPRGGLAMLDAAAAAGEQRLRSLGAVAVGIGVAIVWLVRG